jgi:hypothetical protein
MGICEDRELGRPKKGLRDIESPYRRRTLGQRQIQPACAEFVTRRISPFIRKKFDGTPRAEKECTREFIPGAGNPLGGGVTMSSGGLKHYGVIRALIDEDIAPSKPIPTLFTITDALKSVFVSESLLANLCFNSCSTL